MRPAALAQMFQIGESGRAEPVALEWREGSSVYFWIHTIFVKTLYLRVGRHG